MVKHNGIGISAKHLNDLAEKFCKRTKYLCSHLKDKSENGHHIICSVTIINRSPKVNIRCCPNKLMKRCRYTNPEAEKKMEEYIIKETNKIINYFKCDEKKEAE